MKLTDLYLALLESFDVKLNEEGHLAAFYGSDVIPVTIPVSRGGNKANLPIVLPTEEVLRLEEDGTTIKFHPFAESPFAGQSEVMNRLVILGSAKICATVVGIAEALIHLSVDYENQGKIKNSAMKVIGDMPSVKDSKQRDKVLEYAEKVFRAHTSIAGERPVLRLNMGRRKREDVNGIRWCELSMPVLERDEKNRRIFGVKATSKLQYLTVMKAFEIALGQTEEQGIKAHLQGTVSHTAPYFQSFLMTYKSTADQLNGLLKKLGAKYVKDLGIPTDWTELLDNADDLVEQIKVPFEGNVGAASGKSEDLSAASAEATKAKPVEIKLKSKPAPEVAAPVETVADTPVEVAAPVVETPQLNAVEENMSQTANAMRKTSLLGQSMRKQPTKLASTPASAPAPTEYRKAAAEAQEMPKKPQQENLMPVIGARSKPQCESDTSEIVIGGREKEVYLKDALGEVVRYRSSGKPIVLLEKDLPKQLFLIARGLDGQIEYNGDVPHLDPTTQREVDQLRRERTQAAKANSQPAYGHASTYGQPAGHQGHGNASHAMHYGPSTGQPGNGNPSQQAYGYNTTGPSYGKSAPQYQNDYRKPISHNQYAGTYR
ncbi:hypothetical protein [Vibrio phage vB_VmeM-Yong XC32]|nr:hypothetical protein [Vibrio phage vB_VmeM-Yong XC31]QAX96357.1 hypothetical protein [Vibrio phage vB_VmeM-Yong XC32]QAX96675.1 hypothetical protein [Vibrio phage vB_VmeM-Yong MS31]QAX96993.1 hypothetical protein [Vibrio phage vB_VmeM-Yong MS32]